jgi:hypothetical protein
VPEDTEEEKPEFTETPRRKRCLTYMAHIEGQLGLPAGSMNSFAAVTNFGADVDSLSDDELATFCEGMKATMKHDHEQVKNDILTAIGE